MITGTKEIIIAVIDTGVDYLHEDLDDGRVRTDLDRDFVNSDNDGMDDHGHGTHVAGTIAAETNNGVGVSGVMWHASIMALKALDEDGAGTAEDIASAIRYAADKGACVINMSLGGGCAQTIADAINYAYFEKNVVIVAASGNDGSSISYPAKDGPVIAVGATDYKDRKAYFSNFGPELDMTAPGVTIFSTVPNSHYETFSGTSMATPHVAGVVGLLLAQRPDLTPAQVRAILHQSADDLGDQSFDRYFGYGRLNAAKALQTATPTVTDEPEIAVCSGCAATEALSSESDGPAALTQLRTLRDSTLLNAPGQEWVQIYYEHQWQIAWLMAVDRQLQADARLGYRSFDAALQSLLSANAPAAHLTAAQIDLAERIVQRIAERGSPTLETELRNAWNRANPTRFAGWDVRDAWAQLQAEAAIPPLYLPWIGAKN